MCRGLARGELKDETFLTLPVSLPGVDDDTGHLHLVAQVDGQQRVLAVQVVQDRAALQVHIQVAVHRPVCVALRKLVPDVTFVLRLLVDPRVLLVGQVLDWR